jgi:hypothetical protein
MNVNKDSEGREEHGREKLVITSRLLVKMGMLVTFLVRTQKEIRTWFWKLEEREFCPYSSRKVI